MVNPSRDGKPVKLPYFAFWAADFISGSVAAMTLEERGSYITLLCHQWLAGEIPTEERRLAAMLGLSQKDFQRVWETLESKFPDGRNPRLEQERERARDAKKRQSEGGKKGAQGRWGP